MIAGKLVKKMDNPPGKSFPIAGSPLNGGSFIEVVQGFLKSGEDNLPLCNLGKGDAENILEWREKADSFKMIGELIRIYEFVAGERCIVCGGSMAKGTTDERGTHYFCRRAMEECRRNSFDKRTGSWKHLNSSTRVIRNYGVQKAYRTIIGDLRGILSKKN